MVKVCPTNVLFDFPLGEYRIGDARINLLSLPGKINGP